MMGEDYLRKTMACAGWAADILPQLLRLMDTAGIPPGDRRIVMQLLMQVIVMEPVEVGVLQ